MYTDKDKVVDSILFPNNTNINKQDDVPKEVLETLEQHHLSDEYFAKFMLSDDID